MSQSFVEMINLCVRSADYYFQVHSVISRVCGLRLAVVVNEVQRMNTFVPSVCW